MQTLSASGGATSSGYTCAGAAGSVHIINGTSLVLILDNSNENSASGTCTPFPRDLSGVMLTQLNMTRKACVDLRQAQSNNDVRSHVLYLDASSKVTGDSVIIDMSNASVLGSITGTTTLWLHNAQSGAGAVTAFAGSTMTCSSCTLKMSLAGSDVTLQGSISAATGELKGIGRLSHSGSLIASGSLLSIETDAAYIGGTVRCSGSACTSLVAANETLEMGGTLSCTSGKCSLSLRSGGDMNASGTISCAGNSECLVDVASASSALVSGSMTGSDIRLVIAETLQLLGSVSTSGQGYTETAGDGKGSAPSSCSSCSTDSYRVSGSGGGHGGNGANACYRYSSSYGSIPSGAFFNASTRLARTLDRKCSPACTSPAHTVCMHGNTHAHTVVRDTGSYPCLDAGGASYGNSSFPRTFGSGGGRSCYYYGSCTSYGVGGRGGGRIYMNASSIEITSGATISADGTEGKLYTSDPRYRHLNRGRVVGLDVVLNLENGSGNESGGLLLNLQLHHKLDRSTRWHGC